MNLPHYRAVELVSLSIETDRVAFKLQNGRTCEVSLIAFNQAYRKNSVELLDGKYGRVLSIIGIYAYLEIPDEIVGI